MRQLGFERFFAAVAGEISRRTNSVLGLFGGTLGSPLGSPESQSLNTLGGYCFGWALESWQLKTLCRHRGRWRFASLLPPRAFWHEAGVHQLGVRDGLPFRVPLLRNVLPPCDDDALPARDGLPLSDVAVRHWISSPLTAAR